MVLAALATGREVAEPPVPPDPARADDSAESLMAEARSADALVAMAKLALAAPADCRSLGEGEAYDLDLAIEALVTAGAPRPQGSDDTVRPRG